MRTRLPALLLLLPVFFAPASRAGEDVAPDAITAQIPKDCTLCIRVRSVDRMDTVAKDWIPILEAFGGHEVAGALKKMPLSTMLFAESGFDAAAIDKAQPFYLAFRDPDKTPVFVGHASAGATWEGEHALKHEGVAQLRGGAVVAGLRPDLAVEPRGAPTRMLAGDATLHVYLGDITERNRESLEGLFTGLAIRITAAPGMPEIVRKLALPATSAAKAAVFSVESFDYAATWKDGTVEVEGLLATRPRSPLRRFFQGAGQPGTNDLSAFLPEDAFFVMDFVTTPGWPGEEISGMIDTALESEGIGAALQQVMAMASPFTDAMTGRVAASFSLAGLFAGSTISIAELKPGSDPAKLFAALDMEKANAAMAKIGLPLKMTLEKAVAKHGDVELHRMTYQSEMPQLAMAFSMMQTFMACDGHYLYTVMSPTAQDDICGLIDRVTGGERVEHAHARAMARLGGARNIGLTVNLGALKQLGMIFAMFSPDAAKMMGHIPDELRMSTSITLADGDLHWRGDWPVKTIAGIAAKFTAPAPAPGQQGGAPEPEKEDDFD